MAYGEEIKNQMDDIYGSIMTFFEPSDDDKDFITIAEVKDKLVREKAVPSNIKNSEIISKFNDNGYAVISRARMNGRQLRNVIKGMKLSIDEQDLEPDIVEGGGGEVEVDENAATGGASEWGEEWD